KRAAIQISRPEIDRLKATANLEVVLRQSTSFLALALVCMPAFAQSQDTAPTQGAAVKATAEEVVLDFIVRDKKGKPITDLKPEDSTVLDNGAKQEITSFRLVRGAEAISTSPAAGTC